MTKEEYFATLCKDNDFYYWDKKSDVEGFISIRPSTVTKHKKVVDDAEELLSAYDKIKDLQAREKSQKMIDFTLQQRDNSLRIIHKANNALAPYLAMKRPVVISYKQKATEIVDISNIDELQSMTDQEALDHYRNKRISEAMEKFVSGDFYGNDFALMVMQMKSDLDEILSWINNAKKVITKLPDPPQIKEDGVTDTLISKIILCGVKDIEDIDSKRRLGVQQYLDNLVRDGHVTADTAKRINNMKNK